MKPVESHVSRKLAEPVGAPLKTLIEGPDLTPVKLQVCVASGVDCARRKPPKRRRGIRRFIPVSVATLERGDYTA